MRGPSTIHAEDCYKTQTSKTSHSVQASNDPFSRHQAALMDSSQDEYRYHRRYYRRCLRPRGDMYSAKTDQQLMQLELWAERQRHPCGPYCDPEGKTCLCRFDILGFTAVAICMIIPPGRVDKPFTDDEEIDMSVILCTGQSVHLGLH